MTKTKKLIFKNNKLIFKIMIKNKKLFQIIILNKIIKKNNLKHRIKINLLINKKIRVRS